VVNNAGVVVAGPVEGFSARVQAALGGLTPTVVLDAALRAGTGMPRKL
jgi:hypothetical protein